MRRRKNRYLTLDGFMERFSTSEGPRLRPMRDGSMRCAGVHRLEESARFEIREGAK
jgi:hypothetical protein